MMIKVALFASARDVVGSDNLELNVDESATIADVKSDLAQRYPELVEIMQRSTWAVDHEYVDDQKSLYDNAEVGLIPPVSGG